MHKKIWDEASEQGTGPDRDEVGGSDLFQRIRERSSIWRLHRQLQYPTLARGDIRFATNQASVCHLRCELNVAGCRGNNVAARFQNLRRDFHSFREIAAQIRQRCQEEVAEVVSFQTYACGESVLEQPRHQRFVFRQSDHAVANVARRGNVQFLAKTSARSPIVRNGHDSGQVGDAYRGRFLERLPGHQHHVLQAAQDRGQACASAEAHNTERFDFERMLFRDHLEPRSLDRRALRIEQLGEPRIVCQVLEVRIISRLVPVGRVQANCLC